MEEEKKDFSADKTESSDVVKEPIKTDSQPPIKTDSQPIKEPEEKRDFQQHRPDIKRVVVPASHTPKKSNSNHWIISTIILAVVVIVLLIGDFGGGTGGVIGTPVNADDAAQSVLDFANARGANAELVDVTDDGNFFEVILSVQGQDLPVYVTKDGEFFTSNLIPLNEELPDTPTPTEPTPTEVPKSDLPVAELFIMTHCPYGTQAEKGFIPAMITLGDAADVKIRFVDYYMHTNQQEEVETPRQVCIREEQPEKFIEYLECFLGGNSGTPEEAAACEKEVGIDSANLKDCLDSGRGEEYYAEDSALSEQYEVRGSPTLIINGVQSNAGRSSASYLAGICGAFNEAPEACTTELSSTGPSAGFGYAEGGAGNSQAQC